MTKLPQIKSYAFIVDYFIQNDRKFLIKEKMMVRERNLKQSFLEVSNETLNG